MLSAQNGIEVAHQFFDALQHIDERAIRDLVAPGAILWQNYDNSEKPFESRISGLLKLGSAVPGFAYADRVYMEAPMGAVLQHRILGKTVDDDDVNIPIMARIFVENGRISRFEEYLDRGNLEPLYNAMRA